MTALHYFSKNNCCSQDLLDALKGKNANLNIKNKFGRTPLIEAVKYNN